MQLSNSAIKAGVEITATKLVDAPDNATSVIILRKQMPTGSFVSIATIPILVQADLSFKVVDRNVLSGKTYQYALVVVTGETQSPGASATITYTMPFLHIYDSNGELFAYMEISVEEQRNTSVGYVKPLWGKYPHAIRNGDANYASGSAEALFIPFDSSCMPDASKATTSRNSALDMLTNGLQKVLRTPDGRGWSISVGGEPRVNKDEFLGADTISFDWTEVAAFPETGVITL